MEHSVYYFLVAAVLPLVYFLLKPLCKKISIGSGSHALRLPPGPWKLPVLGSIHHLFRSSLVHHTLRDLSLRHGPLMFLKLGKIPVLVASSPDAAKELMKAHDAIFSTRPLSLAIKIILKDGLGIAFGPNDNRWRQLRKICVMELLSAKRVQSFRPAREEVAFRLVQAISSTPAPLVNVSKLVSMYVADASVHAILGRRFKDQETLLRKVDQVMELAGRLTPEDLFPTSFLVRVLSRRANREMEACKQSLFTFMDRIIREHLERKSHGEEDRHQDNMIDVLLQIQQEGNLQFPLTMRTIEAVIFDVMGGGIETTSTTLHWAMAELMRNPAILSKAQAEIRGVFKGQMKVTEERLGEISYLQLIIKETLRLHPPGPLIPRECQEPCRILGYDSPKGTMVLVNIWAIARNPDYWEEPDTFNPERFLGETRDFKGNDFDFLPFGSGRRICPGMAFGLANIELALASLLFYFNWSLPEGMIPSELDMTETMGITARRKADLLLSANPCVPLPSY